MFVEAPVRDGLKTDCRAPVTTTSGVRMASSVSVKSTPVVWETIVKTFSREAFLCPTRETVTVYGPPTRTLGITKRPFSRVAVP